MKMIGKNLVSIFLCAVLFGSMLIGCGSTSEKTGADTKESTVITEDASTQDNEEELTKLSVGVLNNTTSHLDSILAYTAGFYEDEGLDVTMVNINAGGGNSLQALLSGKVELLSLGATAVLNYIDQGEDLVIIGGQMTDGASIFCTPERQEEFAEINGETLKGKKIGIRRLSTGDIALRTYLYEQGVDLSTVEFVELDDGSTIIQAVLKGELDLGIIDTTYRISAEQQGLVVAKHLDELYNHFICCRLVTTRENLEANRDVYVKAVKANIEAYNLVCTDKEATIQYALDGVEIDEDMIRTQLYDYGHLTLLPTTSKVDIEKFYQSMVNVGYAVNNVDIDNYIDTSIFDDALAELLEEYPDNEIYQELKTISEETN